MLPWGSHATGKVPLTHFIVYKLVFFSFYFIVLLQQNAGMAALENMDFYNALLFVGVAHVSALRPLPDCSQEGLKPVYKLLPVA